jgi:hypothetical protein
MDLLIARLQMAMNRSKVLMAQTQHLLQLIARSRHDARNRRHHAALLRVAFRMARKSARAR